MLNIYRSIAAVAALTSLATGNPLHRRCEGHTCVRPMPQVVPDNAMGRNMLKFQPSLHVSSGCHPFSAVDGTGAINNGLRTTGAMDGSCGADISSGGNVYVRGKQVGGNSALMYCYYFPKDQGNLGIGHRHDWEFVTVWLDDYNKDDAKVVAVAASEHRGADFRWANKVQFWGNNPKIEYVDDWPGTHRMGYASTTGEYFPVVEWDSMPQIARDNLNNHSFEEAINPCKDAVFDSNLNKSSEHPK